MACLLQAGSPFAGVFFGMPPGREGLSAPTPAPLQPQPFKQWLCGYATSHVCFRYHLTGGRIRGCKLNVEVQAQQRLSELNFPAVDAQHFVPEMSTLECDWLLHEGVVASDSQYKYILLRYLSYWYALLVRYKCLFQQWQCLTGPISGCASRPADSDSLLWGCGGIQRLARPFRLHVARGFCLRLRVLPRIPE